MRNLTLANIFITLIAFVIFLGNGFNANATIIEAANIHDKELIARQLPDRIINCLSYADGEIRKSTTSDGAPKSSIVVKITAECSKSASVALNSYELQKFFNGQWVGMKNPGRKILGYKGKASSRNVGWIIAESYLISVDPSECLNAPNEGMLGKFSACMTLSATGYDLPATPRCVDGINLIKGCPPVKPGIRFPDSPMDTDSGSSSQCYYNTTSTTTTSSSTSSPSPLRCNYTNTSPSFSSPFSSLSFLFSFLFFFFFISIMI